MTSLFTKEDLAKFYKFATQSWMMIDGGPKIQYCTFLYSIYDPVFQGRDQLLQYLCTSGLFTRALALAPQIILLLFCFLKIFCRFLWVVHLCNHTVSVLYIKCEMSLQKKLFIQKLYYFKFIISLIYFGLCQIEFLYSS